MFIKRSAGSFTPRDDQADSFPISLLPCDRRTWLLISSILSYLKRYRKQFVRWVFSGNTAVCRWLWEEMSTQCVMLSMKRISTLKNRPQVSDPISFIPFWLCDPKRSWDLITSCSQRRNTNRQIAALSALALHPHSPGQDAPAGWTCLPFSLRRCHKHCLLLSLLFLEQLANYA